jgi:2-amino-4-hydroxy-6-hydroxymethyldihydropteridine diphosphokinase
MPRVVLSLGSNEAPREHLAQALATLRETFGELAVSTVYRTPAVGFDGPDFLNLAVALDTDMPPSALNDWLHALEDRHGRRRDVPRFSNRPLDIDIVLYGDAVLDGPGHLQVPRDELLTQAFVLAPVAEIAPTQRHPTANRSIAELWRDFAGARDMTVEPPLT